MFADILNSIAAIQTFFSSKSFKSIYRHFHYYLTWSFFFRKLLTIDVSTRSLFHFFFHFFFHLLFICFCQLLQKWRTIGRDKSRDLFSPIIGDAGQNKRNSNCTSKSSIITQKSPSKYVHIYVQIFWSYLFNFTIKHCKYKLND